MPRGRPRSDNPTTAAERQRAVRARRKAKGEATPTINLTVANSTKARAKAAERDISLSALVNTLIAEMD